VEDEIVTERKRFHMYIHIALPRPEMYKIGMPVLIIPEYIGGSRIYICKIRVERPAGIFIK
jgi:hypothetical protein